MTGPLRALLVDDRAEDAALVVAALSRFGYLVTHERVDTSDALTRALSHRWDVILAELSLPRLSIATTMGLVAQTLREIPCVVVTHTVGEDAAVLAMRAGACDFVPKSKLDRLATIVERELSAAAKRAANARGPDLLAISERMSQLRTLAAGVAHGINNPLASVTANLEVVLRSLQDPELKAQVQDALGAAERMLSVVNDLAIFSIPMMDQVGSVDVEKLLESSLRLASNEVGLTATVVRSYSPVRPVRAVASRLGYVFLKLLVRGAEALAGGNPARNELRVHTEELSEDRVLVEITASGPGPESVDAEKTSQMTTRTLGLGLYICPRIIDDFGGTFEIDSEPGKRTTFRIALPAAMIEVSPPGTSSPVAKSSAPRRGKILIVDDEPMIIRVVKRMLSADHDVVTLGGAGEAMELIRAGQRFDAIVCDLMMPEMTGMDLHRELKQNWPEQAGRMIFATGGAFTPSSQTFLENAGAPWIEKPFDVGKLRALINELVG